MTALIVGIGGALAIVLTAWLFRAIGDSVGYERGKREGWKASTHFRNSQAKGRPDAPDGSP